MSYRYIKTLPLNKKATKNKSISHNIDLHICPIPFVYTIDKIIICYGNIGTLAIPETSQIM